mgnify:CR=1 FL=1
MSQNSRFPLKACANGCGIPPDPPSLVICRMCMDKISAKLKALAEPNTEAAAKRGEVVP